MIPPQELNTGSRTAGSKSLYTKLTGSSANLKRANDEIDLDEGAPRKLKCCCLANNKLDKILDTVETIKDKTDVVDKVCSLFECVICREVMKKPQFSPCCNRPVGCQQCVSRWFHNHTACPHCSTSGIANFTDFRGADELLTSLRGTIETNPRQETEAEGSDGSDSSDFDLPVFNARIPV